MYNTAKLPSTVILPSNNNVNYHYDGLNRPTSTSINTTTPITAQYTYTGTARGSSLYTTNLISTEVTNAFAYSYTYDRNGNITKIQNGTEQSDGTYDYSSLSGNEYIYDRYNQLKRDVDYDNATATYYSHDSNGNIAEKTVRGWDLQNNCPTSVIESNTYTYADTKGWGDLLTKYNGQSITYDAIGNPLTYRDGITMTWQNGRELATFKKGTVDVSYTYDTGSLRTSKSVVEDFVSTEYNYVYENGLLRQMTYGNHVYNISYDAYGTPVLLNHIIPTSGLNEYYYYGVNSRGDVEALYYSDGSLYATYDYDAYGKLLAITSFSGSDLTGTDTVATKNPLRYRSYVYDTETGFYYLQSRYYDPTTCRFINADVYCETGQGINGFNMFAYCNNNPMMYIDSGGTRPVVGTSSKETYTERQLSHEYMKKLSKYNSLISETNSSSVAHEFIKSYETFEPAVYDDGWGNPTIGYGHLLEEGEYYDTISVLDAEILFLEDILEAESYVDYFSYQYGFYCNQYQYDALVSVSFNSPSSMVMILDDLTSGVEAYTAFTWGESVPGILARRTDEANIFMYNIYERTY